MHALLKFGWFIAVPPFFQANPYSAVTVKNTATAVPVAKIAFYVNSTHGVFILKLDPPVILDQANVKQD